VKKHEKVAAFVESLSTPCASEFHPCYAGFFECFNSENYYEAHDVLEHLWLDCDDANQAFYKGLIQIAGAFVHLKKQNARPNHPKDSQRMQPAVRLFLLGEKNLAPFVPVHLGLNVDAVLALCSDWRMRITESNYCMNPWQPHAGPGIHLSR
jgi:hypothetical protein